MQCYKLSICIATLNRAGYIGETLDSILSQIREDVEVVIVDGASTDGTDLVVGEKFAGRQNCRYERLAKKGGVDQDYCHAVSLARGEYCWLMTDDDIALPGALQVIDRQLKDGPDLLILNAETADKQLTRILVPKKMKIDRDSDFGPGQQSELLAVAGAFISFIGSVVIRRSVWDNRNKESFFGTEFVHFGVIFQHPLERFARVLAKPLIRIRHGNTHWAPRSFDVWMFKWPKLVWGFEHLSDEAKGKVCDRDPWQKTFSLLLMKAQGYYSYRDYRTKLARLPMTWATRFRLVAISLFPDTLYNALLSLLVPVLFPRALGTQIDLRLSPYDYEKRWLGRRSDVSTNTSTSHG